MVNTVPILQAMDDLQATYVTQHRYRTSRRQLATYLPSPIPVRTSRLTPPAAQTRWWDGGVKGRLRRSCGGAFLHLRGQCAAPVQEADAHIYRHAIRDKPGRIRVPGPAGCADANRDRSEIILAIDAVLPSSVRFAARPDRCAGSPCEPPASRLQIAEVPVERNRTRLRPPVTRTRA